MIKLVKVNNLYMNFFILQETFQNVVLLNTKNVIYHYLNTIWFINLYIFG